MGVPSSDVQAERDHYTSVLYIIYSNIVIIVYRIGQWIYIRYYIIMDHYIDYRSLYIYIHTL